LLLAHCSQAQIEQQKRLEVPIFFEQEGYSLLPLDSSGVVLYRLFTNGEQQQTELTCLDTTFQQTWRGFLTLPQGFSFIKTTASNGRIYVFCRTTQKQIGYMVYSVDAKDGSYLSIPINETAPFHVTDFTVTRDAFLISGYFNFRPVILWHSLRTNQSKLLSGFLNQQGELVQIKTYANGEVDVIVSGRNFFRRKSIWIQHYNSDGELLKTAAIEPDESKHLIFGRAARIHNDNEVIAGVYGRSFEYARGIFVTDVNTYGEYVTHYYNFADLKNFFHYMKVNRERRIKERIERRKIKGKKNKFNYRFLVHEVVPYNGQYIMLGEAFYVQYSSQLSFYQTVSYANNFSPWSYGISNNLNKTYSNSSFFNGFHYTHAVVIGFDENANLKWDNSFEINGINSSQLEQFVKVYPTQNHLVLLYLYENIIRTKIIEGSQVIEGTHQNAIQALEGETVVNNSTSTSKLDYWYGNHFLVYGIQSVQHNGIQRKVFFINKISVH